MNFFLPKKLVNKFTTLAHKIEVEIINFKSNRN